MSGVAQRSESITIADGTGNTATVQTGSGFNCYSLSFATTGSGTDSLWVPQGSEDDSDLGELGGIPILFPFAGRMRGPSFKWQGCEYAFPHVDDLGNGIHGMVSDRPWRVVHSDRESIKAVFQLSIDAPDRLACWPEDFHIEAHYFWRAGRLRTEFVITNPGKQSLPFGFGLHPYFRLTCAPGKATPYLLRLPFRQRWTLRGMLPVGSIEPVDRGFRFTQGFLLGDRVFDDVLTDCSQSGRHWVAQVMNAETGVTTSLAASGEFTECVLYTPPHREAVSIEPLTRVPNALELQSRRIGSGLQILEPGEQQALWVEVWADMPTQSSGTTASGHHL